jgi:hypothetical protein
MLASVLLSINRLTYFASAITMVPELNWVSPNPEQRRRAVAEFF